ncbi:MAG: D-tyrosyl-tRNA(Tyr) deacylase [Ruminococcaceae bacterium]|nr:D-tyrosyl-tRNA(Tyr) deacylase [Oscillospiraceae bacterium]
MIAVLQRVKRASVDVDGETVGKCARGLCVLLGVAKEDTEEDAKALVKKLVELRIFRDENDKMNLSLKDIDGELLVVSNFTLLASYKKGRRPDYFGAAAPDEADRLYEYFCSLCESEVSHVSRGIFGADMELTIVNEGPVTIVMDSNVLLKKNA